MNKIVIYKYFFLIFFGLITIQSMSQLVEISEIKVDAENFYVDKLENFYFTKNNSIIKTNKNFDTIATFDYKAFGSISYIDVSNPFISIIFYKDINRIIFLDNSLSELRAPVLLDDLDLYNVDVVCTSSQSGFWAYDKQNSQVFLINKDLIKVQQGVNLYSLVESANATEIIESNNFIFLLFDSGQIVVLDKFGSFYKNLKNTNVKFFDAFNDIIYIINGSNLEIINLQNNETRSYPLPDIRIRRFRMVGDNLYFLSEKSLIKLKIQ